MHAPSAQKSGQVCPMAQPPPLLAQTSTVFPAHRLAPGSQSVHAPSKHVAGQVNVLMDVPSALQVHRSFPLHVTELGSHSPSTKHPPLLQICPSLQSPSVTHPTQVELTGSHTGVGALHCSSATQVVSAKVGGGVAEPDPVLEPSEHAATKRALRSATIRRCRFMGAAYRRRFTQAGSIIYVVCDVFGSSCACPLVRSSSPLRRPRRSARS